MAKRQASDPALFRSVEPLYQAIRAVLESARAGAYRAINTAMVRAYWNVGRLVVEHEQGGAKRAAYGEMVLEGLSRRLTDEFGRGFDVRNLRYMRQFYLTFPISRAPGGKSESAEERNVARSASTASAKRNALRSESPNTLFAEGPGDSRWLVPALRTELSWTHYRLLLGVESLSARDWYMNEAADQHWSTRQLDRQISVLYYERLLASRKKAPVRREAAAKLAAVEPEQFIRDPYILEFLDLKEYPALREAPKTSAKGIWQNASPTPGRGSAARAISIHMSFRQRRWSCWGGWGRLTSWLPV